MPWRLIAFSSAVLLAYGVVIALISRSDESVYDFAWIVSLLAYAGVAFIARRSGFALRTCVATAALVATVDLAIGLPISEVIAPSGDEYGIALIAALFVGELALAALLGLVGVLSARLYGSRRPA